MSVPPALEAGLLDGSEPVWIQRHKRWVRTTTGAIAALANLAATAALSARCAALEVRAAASESRAAAAEAALTAHAARLASLEGREEEAAHFTGTGKLPAVTLISPVTLKLAALTPARAGDVLRPGEPITVSPRGGLPAGMNLAAAFVAADGTVTVQLTATLSLAAGTAALTWDITALR